MSKKKNEEQKNMAPATGNEQNKTIESKRKESETESIRRRPSVLAPYSARDIEREFDRMIERAQRDFDDLLRMPSWIGRTRQLGMMRMPSVDLEDKGNEFVLTADMPGFTKDDNFDINVTDDSVEINAVKRQASEQQDKERSYIRRERSSQVYYRQIRLPEEVRANDAKASLNEGILQIILPKKAPKQKKKLNIT